MSKYSRDDMPRNEHEDERHEIYKAALIDYLTTKTGRQERKDIVKEAINEWLNDKYRDVGKWTMHGILAATLAALAYAYLLELGWRK
jgi:hypothetical protein